MSSPDSARLRNADLAACRDAIRAGSRSFHAASWFLPTRIRQPALALYAFCRLADDAIDSGDLQTRTQRLDELHDRLCAIYEGRPYDAAADRAMTDVVKRFAIPQALPLALLEGFKWDAEGRRYADLPSLCEYAARVAGSVGAMMSLLMGQRSAATMASACDLGMAMQLTNIARDVGEDARAGRLYLPLDWLRQAGLDPVDWLATPAHTPQLAAVIARLLNAADELYAHGEAGIGHLSLDCRPGILAARFLYAEIGCEVKRRGGDAINSRAVVSAGRKARLMLRSLALTPNAARTSAPASSPRSAAAKFLVEAVDSHPSAPVTATAHGRAEWVLDLFERLERRDRAAGRALPA